MNNDKMMLVYGFDALKINKLKEVIRKSKLPALKIVTPEMTSMSLKAIIEGYKFEIVQGNLPKERAIIFNNLEDKELDTAVFEIRKNVDSKAILAAVTPTSIEWVFKDLIEHLVEEREMFEKYRDN